MNAPREIRAYIRRDDISWWAGCEYADRGPCETYISEEPTLTRWGARSKARRLADKARRLRAAGLADHKAWVGDPS